MRLDDGTELDAAAVVTCLGARPQVEWLRQAGITVHESTGGLMVDDSHRVLGQPGLYAAGDLAAVTVPFGGRARIEHWGSALTQGRTAARTLLADLGLLDPSPADDAPAGPVRLPSHSTYVGTTKLTFLGWPTPGRFQEHLVIGELGRTRSLVVHTVNGRAIGAIGVGGARSVNAIRDHITRAAPLNDILETLATSQPGARTAAS